MKTVEMKTYSLARTNAMLVAGVGENSKLSKYKK